MNAMTDAYVALLALEDLNRVRCRLRYLAVDRQQWQALASKMDALQFEIDELREQLLAEQEGEARDDRSNDRPGSTNLYPHQSAQCGYSGGSCAETRV